MEIPQLLTLTTNVLLVILIVVAFLGNSKTKFKFLFTGLNISLLAWSISLDYYYQIDPGFDLLLLGRVNFITIAIGGLFLYFFTKDFPVRFTKSFNIVDLIVLIGIIIVPLSLFSPFVIENEVALADGSRETIFGPLYFFYILYLAITIFSSIYNLATNYYHASIYYRAQLKYLIAGFVMAMVFGLSTNVLFPLIGIFTYQQFGPFATIILSVTVLISIVRHRFLSINLIIGRALEILILAAFAFLMFYLVLFIDDQLGGPYSASSLFVALPISIFFVIIINNLKLLINRYVYENIINKDFNPLTELNLLAQELNKEIKITSIVQEIFYNIHRNLNTQRICIFLESDLSHKKSFFYPPKSLSKLTFNRLDILFHITSGSIIIVDELGDQFYNDANQEIKDIINNLNEESLEIIVKVSNKDSTIGYLILGQKQDLNKIYYSNEIDYAKSLADLLGSSIEKSSLYEEINTFNQQLQIKIKEATTELAKAYDKLKILDEAKSDFISIASHQLRTPLSIIKGYISMLVDGDYGKINAEQKKVMDMTFNAVSDLSEIVNELLTSSRIERGKFTISKAQFDLLELINYVFKLYANKYKLKGLDLKLITPKGKKKFVVSMDREKFEQVIVNLIENAYNYTPEGSVTLTLEDKNKNLLLSVKDTGIGIPPEGKKKLFERFARLDNAQNLRPDGTGIGLFTAKVIVEKHGGKIWFESELGKGTTFFVETPRE